MSFGPNQTVEVWPNISAKPNVLRAYCPKIYTVSGAVGVSGRDWHDQGQVLCHPIAKIVIVQEKLQDTR